MKWYLKKYQYAFVKFLLLKSADCNYAWIVSHSSEKFKTRMLLYIYFKTVPPAKMSNLASNSILFLHEKTCTDGRILMAQSGFVSIAAEICKEFNTRVLLNNYFRIPLALLPWKRLILRYTSILFLHGKVFTERSGQLQMEQSELHVDCYRIMSEI